MKPIVVAAVQLKWQRFENEEALRGTLSRFMRMARDKGATVALLPELMGLLLAAPLAQEIGGATNKGGLLERIRSTFSSSQELADQLPTLITDHSDLLIQRYISLFGDLAREYALVIVAGSLLSTTQRGDVEYRAGVFDSDGGFLGWQSKIFLSDREKGLAQGGEELHYFDSSVGRVGVLLGNDILISPLVEHLAQVGCVGVLNPTLARQLDDWQRQQIVARARAQEHQFYLAQSYLVGEDDLFAGPLRNLEGRSNVLGPVELTPRRDGVLSMIGAEKVEGVVAGEWNVAALENLAQTTDLPVKGVPSLALPRMDEALPTRLLAPEIDEEETLPIPLLTDDTDAELSDDETVDEDMAIDDEGTAEKDEHRTEPIVDPETGYYLGERPAKDDEDAPPPDDTSWGEVLRDAEEESQAE